MLRKEKFPILEYDDETDALINPSFLKERYFAKPNHKVVPDKLIITFFKDVVARLLEEKKIALFETFSGENDLVIYKFVDEDVIIIHGTIGGPACGGFLDELIALGVERIMFCGSGGVLNKEISVGKIIVVDGAIRDDGVSYHYAKPSRIIKADQTYADKICGFLDGQGIPYLRGLVWTTDAFYRETKAKIALRRQEGALAVEMEQAGNIAVSRFRHARYGAIIYGGDDVSSAEWDQRSWIDRKDVRYSLVMTCLEFLKSLK